MPHDSRDAGAHRGDHTLEPEQIHRVERRIALAGFDFFAVMGRLRAEVKAPRTKAQVLELLRAEVEKYARVLE